MKGSSAALGLNKVKASCEKIQHYGNCKDETGTKPIQPGDATAKIEITLKSARDEYREAERELKYVFFCFFFLGLFFGVIIFIIKSFSMEMI